MFIEKSWIKVSVTQSESRYMSRIIKQPELSMKLESLFPFFIYSMKISWLFYLQMCQHCVTQEKVPHKTDKSPVDSICMQWVLRNLFKRMRKYCLYCLGKKIPSFAYRLSIWNSAYLNHRNLCYPGHLPCHHPTSPFPPPSEFPSALHCGCF